MIVVLDPFTLGSIESRFGADPDRAIEAALRHYVRRLRSPSLPSEVPLFMREVQIEPETAIEIQIALPYEMFAELTREARRQEVEFDRIVAHAVFVFLHDIDAGGSGAVEAEESDESSRYGGHAMPDQLSKVRPRGTLAGGRPLRRGGSAGGHGRFGHS